MDTKPMPFPAAPATRKTGAEPCSGDGTVLDFWRWAMSDLLDNTTRGVLAEYLVARALGLADGVRSSWDAHDLTLPDRTKIEVKTSAYLQAWGQPRLSKAAFSIRPSRGWNRDTGAFVADVRRQADVYVFCLLNHRDAVTINPLDLSQWEFFVVPTITLNQHCPMTKVLSLARLQQFARSCCFTDLRGAVEAAAAGSQQRGSVA